MLLAIMAAGAFNLACSVHFKLITSSDAAPFETDRVKVVRIDLASRRWCDENCKETKPIARVSDSVLVLEDNSDAEIDAYDSITVNRESGRYDSYHRINETSREEKGICEARSFSGFPRRKF